VANDDEETLPSGHPSIVVSQPRNPDRLALRRAIHEMDELAHQERPEDLAARMKALAAGVPSVEHVEV
jgi:hypothetical protein